jgi:predicted dehydrogenase
VEVLCQLREAQLLALRSARGTTSDPNFLNRFDIQLLDSMQDAIDAKPDFAVVANPTSLHVEIAFRLVQAGIPFLLEKPVSDRPDGLDGLLQLVLDRNLPVMTGFQMRYHPGYQKMMAIIRSGAIGRPLHAQGYVGQYLPDWRPTTDYRLTSSARKSTGGGVILDLTHELDIVLSILGRVENVSCSLARVSKLDIETEDVADIIMTHHGNTVSAVHVDYLERTYIWLTRVLGEKGSVQWDLGRGLVERTVADGTGERWENPAGYTRNDLFRDQMRSWLAVIEGGARPEVDLAQGIYVTKVALAAKRSAMEKRHIAP